MVRGRRQGKAAIKRDVADTQSAAAMVLSDTRSKKACSRAGGDTGNTLGFGTVEWVHERVIPSQQDIASTVEQPFTNDDL